MWHVCFRSSGGHCVQIQQSDVEGVVLHGLLLLLPSDLLVIQGFQVFRVLNMLWDTQADVGSPGSSCESREP